MLFLSANTYFISKVSYAGIFISCFITNAVYSYVITKIAISNFTSRMIYSLGCAIGCVVGVWLATKI